ncbi:MAG: hypothetical protein IPG60_10595 [Bacteroidetes bacterium]|nr:hypothetical protein [Bacteroidota bacterium]MBP7400495.1 hypothetical protein [Chitinophagales bacterium]MBK7109405.1 hypothetical protein [Bacteroidota bacterium]MBK8487857.1 hypothetical protein [Bacteroidota bacterium]MBK8682387.1 hypothetical protein [Bacteroidota bacterium]
MKFRKFIVVKRLHVSGMTLFPFVLMKHKGLITDAAFVNHERIHLRQQAELLILPFYLLYLLFYFFNLIKYKNHHKAYRNIIFEREAYSEENNLKYLNQRKWWSWVNY